LAKGVAMSKRKTLLGGGILALGLLGGTYLLGFGRSDFHQLDRLVREQIQCTEEAAQILDGVKDFNSAGAARPKLKQILQCMRGQNERARNLQNLSPEQVQGITDKPQPALKQLNEALRAAGR